MKTLIANKALFQRALQMLLVLVVVVSALATIPVLNADSEEIATLRKSRIDINNVPPKMAKVENEDLKRIRNYPMQPPTIPHKIDNYLVNLYSNKCLSCHSRTQSLESQAPMISVTHYMNRDGNFLAEVSPRRYFCNQCHVAQFDAKPLVGNDFQDVGSLLSKDKKD